MPSRRITSATAKGYPNSASGAQLPDLLAVELRHVGMQADGLFGGGGELIFQLRLAAFQLFHLVLDAAARHTVHDRLHEAINLAAHFCQLRLCASD